jgi:hypothetical protein
LDGVLLIAFALLMFFLLPVRADSSFVVLPDENTFNTFEPPTEAQTLQPLPESLQQHIADCDKTQRTATTAIAEAAAASCKDGAAQLVEIFYQERALVAEADRMHSQEYWQRKLKLAWRYAGKASDDFRKAVGKWNFENRMQAGNSFIIGGITQVCKNDDVCAAKLDDMVFGENPPRKPSAFEIKTGKVIKNAIEQHGKEWLLDHDTR